MVDGDNGRSVHNAGGMDDGHHSPYNGSSHDGMVDQGSSHDVLNDGSVDNVAEWEEGEEEEQLASLYPSMFLLSITVIENWKNTNLEE